MFMNHAFIYGAHANKTRKAQPAPRSRLYKQGSFVSLLYNNVIDLRVFIVIDTNGVTDA